MPNKKPAQVCGRRLIWRFRSLSLIRLPCRFNDLSARDSCIRGSITDVSAFDCATFIVRKAHPDLKLKIGSPMTQGLIGCFQPLHAGAHELLNDYLDEARHAADTEAALFRPVSNNRTGRLNNTITPDGVYKLVRTYALGLGLKIGAHALCATAATYALDRDADIAKAQEWLGHANIATTRIFDRRKMQPENPPTFKVSN